MDTILDVRSALAVSSNIALAKLITSSYEGSARKFVRKIERMGLCDSIYCAIFINFKVENN
jgi:tRNA isopentenyl-2-thiomethyl-A-37 hydroxylase MiaE